MRKYNLHANPVICVLLLSIAIFLTIFLFSGLTIVRADGVVGTGSPGSCTEATLNSAVNAGGNITFDCGGAPVTITLTTQKVISVDTTLDGGGLVTLSGTNQRLLATNYPTVTLSVKNITLTNGKSATAPGGAIYNRGTLVIDNSTFTNNNAGDIYTQTYGGAVYGESGSHISVTNSTFRGNFSWWGAAIEGFYGTTVISNSTFTQNSGSYAVFSTFLTVENSNFSNNNGGGISGLTVAVNNSNFIGNNNTYNRGGGIDAMDLVISNSSVLSNTSYSMGGGIFAYTSMDMTDTVVSGNSIPNNGMGGGVYTSYFYSGVFTITNSIISNNSVKSEYQEGGGGIYKQGGSLTINNSLITSNTANTQGGALAIALGGGTTTIQNSTISDNTVTNPNGIGGAIRSCLYNGNPPCNLNLINTTVSNNSAAQGGGVYFDDPFLTPVVFTNTILANNTGGNCYVSLLNTGSSNIDSDGTCGLTATDPLLGPLADNGGPTLSQAPLPGSPALNAGDATACSSPGINGYDQRGRPRFQGGGNCDIGAVEVSININSASDPGDSVCDAANCTLREAINLAQSLPAPNILLFNTGGGPTQTIHLTSPLASPVKGTVLYGSCDTAPGVVLTGDNQSGNGLTLDGGVTLFGLKITDFQGVLIKASSTNGPNSYKCVQASHTS